MITVECLYELLNYNAETGLFTWLINRGRQAKIGCKAGNSHHSGYSYIKINGRLYSAHRLAWLYVYGSWPIGDLDHINLIKTDNRIINLREANDSTNQANTKVRKNNRIGYKGIVLRQGKYRVRIGVNYQRIDLGSYNTLEEAIGVYNKAAEKYFGEFARS